MGAIRLGAVIVMALVVRTVATAQDFQLKVDVSLVSVDVGVYDRRGEAVTTLGQEDFLVFEDNEPQEIRAFEPSSVAFNALLVVDRSGSMRRVWTSMVQGLNRFMAVLRDQDRVAIATFDRDIDLAMDWRGARDGSREKVGIAPEGGGTDFYGAVIWAGDYVRSQKGRKGIIVFSDGQQAAGGNAGRRTSTLERALERARQANVPFYFIGYNTTVTSASEMEQLAEVSGGRVFFPSRSEELLRVYEQIGRDLGRAYSISYAPKKSPDGKFRKIDVRTLDVRLHVSQSRDGYYAR
jgi:VWFA-related protein